MLGVAPKVEYYISFLLPLYVSEVYHTPKVRARPFRFNSATPNSCANSQWSLMKGGGTPPPDPSPGFNPHLIKFPVLCLVIIAGLQGNHLRSYNLSYFNLLSSYKIGHRVLLGMWLALPRGISISLKCFSRTSSSLVCHMSLFHWPEPLFKWDLRLWHYMCLINPTKVRKGTL
jgi:hypothetical protein